MVVNPGVLLVEGQMNILPGSALGFVEEEETGGDVVLADVAFAAEGVGDEITGVVELEILGDVINGAGETLVGLAGGVHD